MDKELELLEPSVLLEFIDGLLKRYENKTDYNIYIAKDWLLEIKQALKRLDSIDNSTPSEALECLERIDNTLCLNNIKGKLDFGIDDEEHTDCDSVIGMVEDLETIKQTLLKAQEPKKYLKWEDLEFKEMYKIIPVRMGDNVYQMAYCLYENEGYIRLEDCQRIYLELFANEKKFFNDLHLERVEE